MKAIRALLATAMFCGGLFGFAGAAMAEYENGQLVRIIVYPDGTVVY